MKPGERQAIEARHENYQHWVNDETEPGYIVEIHQDRGALLAENRELLEFVDEIASKATEYPYRSLAYWLIHRVNRLKEQTNDQ